MPQSYKYTENKPFHQSNFKNFKGRQDISVIQNVLQVVPPVQTKWRTGLVPEQKNQLKTIH